MKLNWAERLAVNNPLRVIQQRLEIRWMNRQVALPPEARVLEVGCGRGAGASLILREFRPRAFFAMDLDARMIGMARRFLDPPERDRIRLFVADLFRLPHSGSALDAIFGFGVLHHVPDWQGALREMARVVRPGGLFYMEELYPALYQNAFTKHILLHPRENRFRSPDLRRELGASGFQLEVFLEHPWMGILGISVRK